MENNPDLSEKIPQKHKLNQTTVPTMKTGMLTATFTFALSNSIIWKARHSHSQWLFYLNGGRGLGCRFSDMCFDNWKSN